MMNSFPIRLLVIVTVWIGGTSLLAQETIRILPGEVHLTGKESSQRLLLQSVLSDLVGRQITEGIQWTSADPAVAIVGETGTVTPVGNGTTTITASAGGATATVNVSVADCDQPVVWSFRHDVLPALTKAGCNMGPCHGALAGKGGFRLSLRGYDPLTDHFNIVKQDRGRRVEFTDPGRSLVLAKPSGALPHKGGLKLDPQSRDYRIVAEWIAGGAAPPSAGDAIVESIEVLPGRVKLQPGDSQQLVVLARDSQGRVRDVTHWAKWSSSNEAVAQCDDQGKVTVTGPGEGAIVAWFSSRIALARIMVPFPNEIPDKVYDELAARNFIDELVNAQLRRLRLPASGRCDDATFIRRAFLDTIGVLPTRDEVQQFLADKSEEKRDKLIDSLLARPEYVDFWTYKWSDVLMLNGQLLRPDALKAYYQTIHRHVADNTPWDVFVRNVLTATGSTFENGATNFYSLFETPEDMTENACQAFLGLSIGCAKCHNHPLEKWTNDLYYAMANMFSRVRLKGWGGERRNGDGLRTVYVVESGELVQPRTGKPQPPTPLDGEPLPFDDPTDRRVHLANWLTSPENPYFAKSITNRVWAAYFGPGLVEQVDDMRVSNPATNEELMDRAAKFLVENKFDLKALMKEILRSNTYQRSSVTVAGNETDQRYYSRYFPRRLTAEVLHDAVVQVTKVPTKFDQIAFPGADFQKTDMYPEGTRATQLQDSAVDSYFLKAFGRNPRNIVCDCERSNEPSMIQVLHLSNGETLNEKLKSDKSRVAELMVQLDSGMSWESLVDETFLWCVARYPTTDERVQFVALLRETPAAERRAAVEDLFWSLLSSREFIFNH